MESPAAKSLGAEHDSAGRVLVQSDLTLKDHPEIFVACFSAISHPPALRQDYRRRRVNPPREALLAQPLRILQDRR